MNGRSGEPARHTCAIVTPSYYKDFERCAFLAETVLRFVPPDVHHYILVDRADEAMFSPLRGPRTHLVLKEDILPWWLVRLPVLRGWWASLKSPPVRGWILQQLAKLSVNRAVPADVYIFLDSGAFFVRPYDPQALIKGDKVPLFREQGPHLAHGINIRWHRIAAELLGVPKERSYDTAYVGNLVYWRRDNLERMQARIADAKHADWIAACCRKTTLSEYVLYGFFVERVLGEAASGHWYNSAIHAYSHWSEVMLDDDALRKVKDGLAEECAVVMINEKSRTPPERIRRVFGAGT